MTAKVTLMPVCIEADVSEGKEDRPRGDAGRGLPFRYGHNCERSVSGRTQKVMPPVAMFTIRRLRDVLLHGRDFACRPEAAVESEHAVDAGFAD